MLKPDHRTSDRSSRFTAKGHSISALFIGCFLMGNPVANAGQAFSASVYLPPKKIIDSPNGEYSCYTEALSSGQILYLQRAKRKILLHATGRNLGVDWAPNSKWLAVEDNDAAGENCIIVYDVSRKTPPVIATTPLGLGEAWAIKKWDVSAGKLLVHRRGSKAEGIPPRDLYLNLH